MIVVNLDGHSVKAVKARQSSVSKLVQVAELRQRQVQRMKRGTALLFASFRLGFDLDTLSKPKTIATFVRDADSSRTAKVKT